MGHQPVAAQDDLPVLPSNFFNDPAQTGHWSWEADFQNVVEIGKGKDTLIYSAVCSKLGGRRVAVKVYDKTKVQATKYRAIKREIAMMMFFMKKCLPTVVEYYGAFHDDAHLYIVMEYCGGGDLLEKLLRDKKAMNEKRVAMEVAYPCLSVLKTMHEMRIIHRDIKLENIFIDDGGHVKLGDFGLTMSMKQESAISPVGTVEYMAPEVVALPAVDLVISGQIKATDIAPTNEKVDIWALGVTVFELVTGRLPFEGKDKPEIKRNITANNLAALPSFLTPQCQSFIRAMLTYHVDQRPSCAQLLQHPYITMYCSPPAPKPAALPNVIALHAYSPGPGRGVGEAGTLRATWGSGTGSSRSSASTAGGAPPAAPAPAPVPVPRRSDITYRDALAGGRAPAPPAADEMRSPRTPGGSHVPVTVSRNAAASCAQHSPTILARQDPFASPLRQQDGQQGGGNSVPRKISFDFLSPAGTVPGKAALAGEAKGGAEGGLVNWRDDVAAYGQPTAAAGVSGGAERKRSSLGGNVKLALRKMFRGGKGHERLLEDPMDADLQQQPSHTQ